MTYNFVLKNLNLLALKMTKLRKKILRQKSVILQKPFKKIK